MRTLIPAKYQTIKKKMNEAVRAHCCEWTLKVVHSLAEVTYTLGQLLLLLFDAFGWSTCCL
jgi:hypothetical protein